MVQYTRNEQIAVTATSLEIAQDLEGFSKRRNIVIRNISPNVADIITLALGRNVAIANSGIQLKQNDSWFDSDDGTGYECWQNQIQAICATANGVLAIFER